MGSSDFCHHFHLPCGKRVWVGQVGVRGTHGILPKNDSLEGVFTKLT